MYASKSLAVMGAIQTDADESSDSMRNFPPAHPLHLWESLTAAMRVEALTESRPGSRSMGFARVDKHRRPQVRANRLQSGVPGSRKAYFPVSSL